MVFSVKNSILCFLFGICYERGIFWHKLFGWATLIGALLHLVTVDNNRVSGWITIGSLFFILVTSFQPFRMRAYELFLRFHWIGLIVITVGIFMH